MPTPSSTPPEAPLDSWKAIAAYLGRDVRTVRRWEASEGLPVQRHRHLTRRSVYAYASELDLWRASRRETRLASAPLAARGRLRTAAVASLGALTLLAGGDRWLGMPDGPSAQERGLVAREVWSDPTAEVSGTPTPDGRAVTFVDWTSGDVAVRNLATGVSRRITGKGSFASSAGFAQWPVVSRNGAQVAFLWFNGEDFDLRVAPFGGLPAGSTGRVLLHDKELPYVQPFDWLPDDQRLLALVFRLDGTSQIALVDAAVGTVRVLKSLEWRSPTKMSLSPDGRYIAYDLPVGQGSVNRDIFILSIDGREDTPLVTHPALDYGPLWTPDGNAVLFVSDRRGTAGLWTVRVADGRPSSEPELVKTDVGQIIPLGISSNGAYHYGVRAGTQDVYLAELDPRTGALTKFPSRLTERFEGSNLAGSLSPDGRRLAYVSRRGALLEGPGSMAIVIRSLEKGEEHDFHLTLHLSGRRPVLRWFPDGRSILLTAQEGGRWSFYRMNPETGAVAALATGLGTPGYVFQPPSISPDGRTVLYFRPDAETHAYSLMAYHIDTRRQEELFRSKEAFLSLGLAPHGHLVAMVTSAQPRTLLTMSLDGTGQRELFHVEQREKETISGDGLAWSTDGQFIYFVRSFRDEAEGAHDQIWRVPAAGGTAQRILSSDGTAFPTVDREGRRLVFTAGKMAFAALWVMENVVPTR